MSTKGNRSQKIQYLLWARESREKEKVLAPLAYKKGRFTPVLEVTAGSLEGQEVLESELLLPGVR